MAPDGGGARKLVAWGSRPAFSPDGSKILFSDPRGWVAEIGADGRRRRNIVKGGVDPAWSPDGRRIVYETANGLHVIGADGKGRKRILTPELRHDLAPAWRPAG